MNPNPAVFESLVTAGAVVGGKYRLIEPLGAGGIAEVWDAVNVDLDAPVAVKVCRPTASDTTSVLRLIQEARAAARLMHPSIVRVYDTGLTEQGAPYIVMERLRGATLRAELEREGPIDLLYVVNTMIAVADALELAHRHGIVHRDVKPDNIFLAEVDAGRVQPKLLDFGIIKIDGVSATLTQTGTTLGSPAYMAPEQAGGEGNIDARADVWSACVVLFEAMTGRLPFEAPNYNALMRRILLDPVPEVLELLEQASMLTPFAVAVARVVQRGLHKDRDARWQSAAELRDALGECVRLVLPKESTSSGSITAYHLVRVSTVPKDVPTINQWSGAHESAPRANARGPSRWLLGVLLLSWVGAGALAWSLVSSQEATLAPEVIAPGTQASSFSAKGAADGQPAPTNDGVAQPGSEALPTLEVERVPSPPAAVNVTRDNTTNEPTEVKQRRLRSAAAKSGRATPHSDVGDLGLKEAYSP